MRTATTLLLLVCCAVSYGGKFEPFESAHLSHNPRYRKLPVAVQVLLHSNPAGLETLELDLELHEQIMDLQAEMEAEVCKTLLDRFNKKATSSRTEERLNQLVDQQIAAYQELITAQDFRSWMQGFRQASWRLNGHDWLAEREGFETSGDQRNKLKDNARRNHGAYDEAFAVLVEIVGETKAIDLIGDERSGRYRRPEITVPDEFDPKQLVTDWLKMRADVERTKIEIRQTVSADEGFKRQIELQQLQLPIIHANARRKRMIQLARMTGTDLPLEVDSKVIFVGKVETVLDGDTFLVLTRDYVDFPRHALPRPDSLEYWISKGGQDEFQKLDQAFADKHVPAREMIVRLSDVDAPELDQPGGNEARDSLRELCEGKFVICNTNGCGEPLIIAKRVTARVFTEGKRHDSVALQTSLLDAGMAWAATPRAREVQLVDNCRRGDFGKGKRPVELSRLPPDYVFQERIGQSRMGMGREQRPKPSVVVNRIGLWADADPIAPWNWRAQHRFVAGKESKSDQIRYLVTEQLPKEQFELLAQRLADKLKLKNAIVSFYTSRPLVTMTWTDAVDRTTKHHVAKAVFRDGELVELTVRSGR